MNQAIEPGFAAAGGFQPLYREVKRLLTQSLIEGEWPAGTALPSETRLAKRYSVSIGTLPPSRLRITSLPGAAQR